MAIPPVANFRVTSTSYNSISLAWDLYSPRTTVNNFYLYVGLESDDRSNMISLGRNNSTYLLDSYPFGQGFLAPGTLYYITIVGHHNPNRNSPETQISESTMAVEVPPLVSIIFSSITSSGFIANLEYDPVSPPQEIAYRINANVPPVGPNFDIASTPATLVFDSREEDTYYYLQVICKIDGVESTPLLAGVFTSNSVPSNFTVVGAPTSDSITLGWDPSPTPTTGYDIWISLNSEEFEFFTTLGNVNTYTYTFLDPSTTYYFKLVDLGNASPSPPTFTLGITADLPPPPEQNNSNLILYVFKATNGFKHSTHSLKRSSGGPVLRQIRGGW